MNLKMIWRGEHSSPPVDLNASIASTETICKNNNAFTQQLPDYVRMDGGVYIRRDLKKYAWTFSVDIQNFINRLNVEDERYNPLTRSIIIEKNLGIIPVFAWKIEFGI